MWAIVDCNSFYCSCERVFRPELQHQPVVVLSNNDGCIIARTDEAKLLGLDMTGPYFLARHIIETEMELQQSPRFSAAHKRFFCCRLGDESI